MRLFAAIKYAVISAAIILLTALPARVDEPVSAEEDLLAEQGDLYYNAMLRSIDLDRRRWLTFSRSLEGGPWFYDSKEIRRTGKRVSSRVAVFPHPLKTDLYSAIHTDHRKIRKIEFDTEIDCGLHSYRQTRIMAFGYYGELLTTHDYPERKFSTIKAGTTTDTLRGLLCKKTRTRR